MKNAYRVFADAHDDYGAGESEWLLYIYMFNAETMKQWIHVSCKGALSVIPLV